MYQIILGKISELSKYSLPAELRQQAPGGLRCNSWLAGRALLSLIFYPDSLPVIFNDQNGKPHFHDDMSLWFNISHSDDDIVLLLSDEGEVGCDIEAIRPRKNWLRLANAVFSEGEHKEIEEKPEKNQLAEFWRIWTLKEAIVKQRSDAVCQIASIDSTQPGQLFLSHCQLATFSLAVCTLTPFTPNTVIKFCLSKSPCVHYSFVPLFTNIVSSRLL